MTTLLKVQASLFGENGQSSRLANRLIEQWLLANPDGRVITRDLNAIPHLTAERFQAFATKENERTQKQQEIVRFSDTLIDELQQADVIVLTAPMYNFSVPSTLRAYFDHIARSGVSFRYTADGPEGLIKGKKAYVFITRGGMYEGASDTQTPYLRQFLGFIGITDVEIIYAEGLAMGAEAQERSLAAARHQIAKALPVTYLAA